MRTGIAHCQHNNKIGDNYGITCQDCGKQIEGYGYGGWFNSNLTGPRDCIHRYLPVGDDEEVCQYCESWRMKEQT